MRCPKSLFSVHFRIGFLLGFLFLTNLFCSGQRPLPLQSCILIHGIPPQECTEGNEEGCPYQNPEMTDEIFHD